MKNFRPVLMAAVLASLAPGAPAGAQESKTGVASRVEVVIRTVRIFASDSSGAPLSRPIRPEDVEVLEDGVSVEVVAVEPLDAPIAPFTTATGPVTSATARDEGAGDGTRPVPSAPVAGSAQGTETGLRQVVYFDAAFLHRLSGAAASKMIDAAAERIAAAGPVEVVLAAPDPRLVAGPTRDVAAIRAGLKKAMKKVGGRDELLEIRLDAVGKGKFASRAIAQELIFVESALDRLADWLLATDTGAGGALYVISDGFDVSPREYYRTLVSPEDWPAMEDDSRLRARVNATRSLLASRGWVAFPLASTSTMRGFLGAAEHAGPSQFRRVGGTLRELPERPQTDSVFVRPIEPLSLYADATGGLVVASPARLDVALKRLGGRMLLSYRPNGPADGKTHDLKVKSRRADVVLAAPQFVLAGTSEMTAGSSAKGVLLGGVPSGRRAGEGLEVSLRVVDAAVAGKKRSARLLVDVALGRVPELLAKLGAEGDGRMRVTIAVERDGQEPFVHHEELAVGDAATTWGYEAPINWSGAGARLAVRVEELRTGVSGEAEAKLPD